MRRHRPSAYHAVLLSSTFLLIVARRRECGACASPPGRVAYIPPRPPMILTASSSSSSSSSSSYAPYHRRARRSSYCHPPMMRIENVHGWDARGGGGRSRRRRRLFLPAAKSSDDGYGASCHMMTSRGGTPSPPTRRRTTMAMDASSVETSDINDDDIDGDDDGDDAPNIEDNDDENINDEYGVVRSSSLGGGNVLGCDDDIHDAHSAATYFEAVVNARYACTRFRRHREEARTRIDVDFDDNAVSGGEDDIAISSSSATRASTTSTSSSTTPPAASISDPAIVDVAYRCLSLSTRAPTGFNAQPYRMILVHSRHDKENVARYCLGRNADRVRDSDCTAVFLADAECGRDWHSRYANFLLGGNANDATTAGGGTTDGNDDVPSRRTGGRTLSKRALLKLRLLILLFSSGYPLPRCVSMPISFCVRCGVSFLGYLARLYHHISRGGRSTNDVVKWLLPTLYPSDTWSQKNTMLVAMTYMLACTSHGLATCPMEGYDAIGIKAALGVPMGRYTVPLIVCAGRPYHRRGNDAAEDETDDAGLGHGGKDMSPRYPMEEVVYRNGFGEKLR